MLQKCLPILSNNAEESRNSILYVNILYNNIDNNII